MSPHTRHEPASGIEGRTGEPAGDRPVKAFQ